METKIQFDIGVQPDDFTCGATCLNAVYRYYGDSCSLDETIRSVVQLESGGTIPAYLGCSALARGYRVTIYSYELQLFDPTWGNLSSEQLIEKLTAQAEVKQSSSLRQATTAYLRFLSLGGKLCFEDLTSKLLRRFLVKQTPILTGLCSTYLYQSARELENRYDDIRGHPAGHFVVLCGYDRQRRKVLLADPYLSNPTVFEQTYEVSFESLICAIFLGILTYDSALVVIEPAAKKKVEK